jgi:predicted O-methyltransferase YrrM
MAEPLWTSVDEYVASLFIPKDPALDAAVAASEAAGLPAIAVSPAQGKLLYVLALALRARRILEIGTLGAYSTIWLARALPPEGRVVTLELDPTHAAVARANLARAGLTHQVEVRLGPALETLPRLAEEGAGPFDLVFIDADKPGYPHYWRWALRLSRPGTLIVADNVVRQGAVADAGSADANVQGVRRYLECVAAEPGVTGTVLQTVGVKGYDGLSLAVVTSDRGGQP